MKGAMLDTVEIVSKGTRVTLPGGGWRFDPGATVTTIGMIGPLSKTAIEMFTADRVEYKGLEQIDVPKDTVVSSTAAINFTSARHGTTRKFTIEGVTPLDTYAVSRSLIVKAVA